MEKTVFTKALSIMVLPGIFCLLLLNSCSSNQAKDATDKLELVPLARTWTAHVRGLDMVDDQIAWASGSRGHFMRCIDGLTWSFDTIPGFTHLDFRDVEGFDAMNALVMASGVEGVILRTSDGGLSWHEVYANHAEGIFLDGMDFQGKKGYCYGDPVNGKTFLIESEDAGVTWKESDTADLPEVLDNEAGFAASGTGICHVEDRVFIATGGGETARIFHFKSSASEAINVSETPLLSEEGCGIFSIAFKDAEHGIAVGGCYLDSTNAEGNCAITSDGGLNWKEFIQNGPRGYRSCVAYAPEAGFYLTCGRTGIEYSIDEGNSWTPLSDEGYFTCSLSNKHGWLMGRYGKIAHLTW